MLCDSLCGLCRPLVQNTGVNRHRAKRDTDGRVSPVDLSSVINAWTLMLIVRKWMLESIRSSSCAYLQICRAHVY